MKLISRFELCNRTDNELAAIFRRASAAYAVSPRGSQARLDALATLENVGRERAARKLPRP